MTKQTKTNSSTNAPKRINLRQLLRSALAAGVVAGFASSVSAQSGDTLPSFPSDTPALSLPVSQDTPLKFSETLPRPSASKRIASLLGIKKQAPSYVFPQSNPTVTLPSFPSTEPTLAVTKCDPEQAVASNSHAPTICRSTSGKTERSELESRGAVMLASADETLSQSTNPSAAVVQAAKSLDESVETESLSESLTESLSESLFDVEIPKALVDAALVDPTQAAPPRVPELVRRPPAMQLHIGGKSGGPSANTVPKQPSPTPTNYSFSDSSESQPQKTVAQAAKTMNVRIEGEPVLAQVIARPKENTVASEAPQKSTIEPSSRGAGNKSLSDKGTEHSPVMGQRLDVGLHESTNVETAQAISGLSVEHPEFCQVLKSGERSVSFVGLKAGQTRVALFTTDASGERKIEIREVVIAGTENRQTDMKSLATQIGRSVHSMFPKSHIEVIAEAEGLTVQGYASSEEEAKKIIGLVRRTSLQPVVDRLATYK